MIDLMQRLSNYLFPPAFGKGDGWNSDPVRCVDGEWGFYDETWSNWHGGYTSEAQARRGLQKYCDECL